MWKCGIRSAPPGPQHRGGGVWRVWGSGACQRAEEQGIDAGEPRVTTTRESCGWLLSRESKSAPRNNKIVTGAARHSRGCESRAQRRPGRRRNRADLAATAQHSTASTSSTRSTRAEDGSDPFIPGSPAVIRTTGNRKAASPQRPSMSCMPERASCVVLLRLLAQVIIRRTAPGGGQGPARDGMAPLANDGGLFSVRPPQASRNWLA